MLGKILAIAVAACCLSSAALAQKLNVTSDGPVMLPGTRQLIVYSPSLDRDFLIRISPPAGGPTKPGEKAAAVYVFDGNMYFGLASDTLRLMALEPGTWPAYVIAVGYDTSKPVDVMVQRAVDFLYSSVKGDAPGESEGGGGEAFARFVIEELKPYIEAALPVDPQRSFAAGHSYGGLFLSSLIARMPDAFAGYVIGSPSVWANATLVEEVAKAKGAGRPVYLSVGEKEVFSTIDMVADADKLLGALTGAGFAVTHRVHAEQTHVMEPNIMFAEGLRLLLAKPEAN
ncbi:MAG: alpha/beta hydrolase-fold protein [Hyphomonadaceae bacterium]|nr:alpha/beta hydrolase-fold protein [Hyphomonadaceae bacterium]